MKFTYLAVMSLLTLSLFSCNNAGDFGKTASSEQSNKSVGNDVEHEDHKLPDDENTGGDSSGSSGGSTGGSNGGDPGVMGGHFDLDTAHLVYPLRMGESDAHVHEYDDLFSNEVDYFNLADPNLGEIQDVITDQNQEFFILVSNAELSVSPILEINGVDHNIVTYQNSIRTILSNNGVPQRFVLGNATATAQKLSSLKLVVPVDALSIQNGLIATSKGCAIQNVPGLKGEYRNGSLTIQAISAKSFNIDPVMKVAALNNGGLLWESFIFWHKNNVCYGN